MDTLQFLMQGFAVAMTPQNLMFAMVGAFIGTLLVPCLVSVRLMASLF